VVFDAPGVGVVKKYQLSVPSGLRPYDSSCRIVVAVTESTVVPSGAVRYRSSPADLILKLRCRYGPVVRFLSEANISRKPPG
jgi:hypothetical protein